MRNTIYFKIKERFFGLTKLKVREVTSTTDMIRWIVQRARSPLLTFISNFKEAEIQIINLQILISQFYSKQSSLSSLTENFYSVYAFKNNINFQIIEFDFMKPKKSKQEVLDASSLISDFTDQNIEKRINAAKKLPFIAEILGWQRVKNELIPYLKQQVLYDEAPVVSELFNNIESLGEFIGGPIPYTFLLPLLQEGLEYEEQKVRKQIVQKYYNVAERCQLPKCENQIVASLKKIYTNEFDQVKEAFCCVVARKLGFFSVPNQQELIANYLSFVEDSSIIKRKYAAKYSKDLIKWLGCAEGTILKIIELLSKDKQESNKIYLIDAIIELSREKTPATLQSYFNIISYQFSWRIRYELISKIEKLAEAMGKEQFKSFLPYYTKYLNDIEPQIRSIANNKLTEIIPYLQADDIINRILPALKNIPQDTHAYVRNSLASSLLQLCSVIGKKHTIDHILPKFLTFLKDEQEQQVKQTIFKKINLICQTLGIETLSQSILPVVDQMVASQSWRLRSQSIKILGYLIKNSSPTFITQKINKIIVDFLKDRANSVRKEVTRLMIDLIDQHGQSWTEKNIIPKLLPMFKSSTYMHRQSILLALETFIPKLSVDCLSKLIVANVCYLAQDPVENVRMSVCITLGALYPCLPKQKQQIKKVLKNLKEDKDIDVKQLAAKTFSKLD